MSRLSSRSTFFFKRVFPLIWFGFVVFGMVTILVSGVLREAPAILLSPMLLVVIGYVVMKRFVWILVDEVHDQGDSLLVRNHGEAEVIPLSNILSISRSMLVNPPQVRLHLVTPCRWGDEIVFSPSVGIRLNPFAGLPAIDDLVMRVERVRAMGANQGHTHFARSVFVSPAGVPSGQPGVEPAGRNPG